jgi:YegS/Rv2252/BmrU family lipid kinase
MKIRFIINPISGTGKQKGIENLIAKNLSNFDYTIVYTKESGSATEISRKAIEDKIDIVVAVGGDGTVNECAKAVIGTDTALGVIPCGSGNGFAYHIGMEKNIEQSIKQLNNCSITSIDSCTANGIPFVNVSGIGFDAHIAHLFANLTNRGFSNYIKLIYKELKYKARNYTIDYDGKTEQVNAILISFANASQYGNNFQISPHAKTDDGLIDFVIVKDFPRWKILALLLKIAKGKAHLSKYIRIIQTDKMSITTNEKVIHLDGEPYSLSSPIIIQIHPLTLKIFSPNG